MVGRFYCWLRLSLYCTTHLQVRFLNTWWLYPTVDWDWVYIAPLTFKLGSWTCGGYILQLIKIEFILHHSPSSLVLEHVVVIFYCWLRLSLYCTTHLQVRFLNMWWLYSTVNWDWVYTAPLTFKLGSWTRGGYILLLIEIEFILHHPPSS